MHRILKNELKVTLDAAEHEQKEEVPIGKLDLEGSQQEGARTWIDIHCNNRQYRY